MCFRSSIHLANDIWGYLPYVYDFFLNTGPDKTEEGVTYSLFWVAGAKESGSVTVVTP